MQTIAGIDYGSKRAGTTALCYNKGQRLFIGQSEKQKDADQWLFERVREWSPQLIGIDAPTSLPGKYFGRGEDYFYRAADRELKAMSPMFLGGLTARAIKMKDAWTAEGLEVIEVYPGGLARQLALKQHDYKGSVKSVPAVTQQLQPLLNGFFLTNPPANWHQLDALLAWLVAYRYVQGSADSFGDEQEGVVWV